MLSASIGAIGRRLLPDKLSDQIERAGQRAKFYLRELYQGRRKLPGRVLYKKIRAISEHTKTLQDRGLYIGLAKEEGGELDVLLPDIPHVVFTLRKNEFFDRIGEIEYFLRKVISAYEKEEEQDIPVGRLDLLAALKQFNEAVKAQEPDMRAQLEDAHAIRAVKDHLDFESYLAINKKLRKVLRLLSVTRDEFVATGMSLVNTAQELWPGGNPCIMMSRTADGRPALVPIAVALEPQYFVAGRIVGIELSKYYIPITRESRNPFVHFFLNGGGIEEDITIDRHREVCAGFINRRIRGRLEELFWGISYPKPPNTLLTSILSATHPVSKEEVTLGLFAILMKGHPSRDDTIAIQEFLAAAGDRLGQIMWREELRGAVREARAYAREKEEYAERLEKMQIELVERERMAALGKMAAVASHGFKNFLQGMGALIENQVLLVKRMQAALDIIKTKIEMGAAVDADLRNLSDLAEEIGIETGSSRNILHDAEEVVRRMLSFAKAGSGKKQIVPVSEFVQGMIRPHEMRAKQERISFFVIDRLGDKEGIAIDPVELRDLLGNLISNAFESFGHQAQMKTVRFSIRQEEGWIVFIIQDNGMGMPPEKIPRLFVALGDSTKEGGTGVGMVTVKKIVDANKGDIWVESKVGEGTKFTLSFPRVEAERKAIVVKRGRIISKSRASKINVMYVEDEERVRKPIRRILENMGFPVMVFESAEEALQALVEEGFSPDLIITDQTLGDGMQGHEFLRRAAAEVYKGEKMPPFIIHSGDVTQKDEVAEIVSGLNIGWIEKGSDIDSFRTAVSRIALGDKEAGVSLADAVSLPEELKDDPVVQWGRLVAHKANNLIAALQWVELEDRLSAEDFAELRKALGLVRDEFRKIQEFARSAKDPNLWGQDWDVQVPDAVKKLPENIINDPYDRTREIWNAIKPSERYKLALVCELYLKDASSCIRELESLDKPDLNREEINRVREIFNNMKRLNFGFGISFNAEKEIAERFLRYYEYLAIKPEDENKTAS